MKIIKLILLACPVVLASMLLVANPAAASYLKSIAAVTQQVTFVSAQPVHPWIAPNLSSDSQAIIDQLGCSCATCVQAKLQMEGKLSLSDLL
ncbi:hypothetical protein CEN45_16690 [Fischerella thermalis CCMEE 5198]|jgi:hypothetical protein|uniref:hypothetical protein n=1 Tax=Fischerella thermalis TaxID=372787 RepID=UPI000C80311E|nr:hypothetical protein [Fischerella thermalis]PLZ99821.1 hypothetical protein CI594_10795 [Fischerella thermalis CCMEE 5196]PMB20544.1 hypothetical protein CEN45_16690 [Fischerella thermalis CCMEE 5198]PMB52819.1 hypothetical protein CEN39_07795 [Fischerella thermalis CCMEE 5201]